MIEDLRFVEREIMIDETTAQKVRILQAYDGHVWFDVPLVDPLKIPDMSGNFYNEDLVTLE